MVHRMKQITSVNNEYIKSIAKLNDKKNRCKAKKFIIEGFHLITEAYNAGLLLEILTIKELNNYSDVNQIIVSEQIIQKLSSTANPQGVVGVCEMKNDKTIKGSKILLLDNINDPGNMGTIIRASLGFNIDTIILSEDCADIYNLKTLRASQGSIFHMNIIFKDLKEAIRELKENNIYIIGTSLRNAIPLKECKINNNYAILLGNEANGVRKELLEQCDCNIKIEINNKLESLNVAVAGSIIMYYLNK